MKTDLYTRIILTVIAVCLIFIVLKQTDIVTDAFAEDQSTANGNVSYGMVPLNPDGSINVKLSRSDEIDVNVASVGGYSVFSGQLKVKIEQ